MKQKKVLILGASASYVNCIRDAREMGCKVLVADMNARSPGFKYADIPLHLDITDIDGCLQAAKEYRIDGIVAVNDFGVMTAARVANELGLPGLPVDIARIVTDKYLMRETWRKNGAPSIQYRKTRSFSDFLEATRAFSFPLIVKPCDSRGGGSRGVCRIDETSDLRQVYEFSNSFYRDDRLLVEEFVQGREHSVEAIIDGGRVHIIAISDKVKSPLPFRVDDTILYPTTENGPGLKMLKAAVEQSITSIGIKDGIAHVELAVTEKGPVLFEIGARCGGGAPSPLVPYLSGVEEFKEAVRIALGEKPRRLAPLRNKGCVIKFFYPKPGRVTKISGLEKVENTPGLLSLGLFVREGDYIHPLRTCKDRAGMIITGGETRDEALGLASAIINSVHIETIQDHE